MSATVFLDIAKNGKPFGRLEIVLYDKIVPKTAENFRALCTGEKGFGFKGRNFMRIIPDYIMEVDGEQKSIYGGHFEDENFDMMHDNIGTLSMSNTGQNTNGDKFFISLGRLQWLNGKHVVFGYVKNGLEYVNAIGNHGSIRGTPTAEFTIADCGEL